MAEEPEKKGPCSCFGPGAAKLRIPWFALRVFMAETLGTFILMFVGCGSVAQVVLSDGKAGNQVTIAFSWGFAVMLGIYACGKVSGGHLNPAVTFALATANMFEWIYVPLYWVAQFFGSFLGSLCTYFIYLDGIHAYDYNLTTAGIFATYPQPYLSLTGAFFDQVFVTALLLLCVCSMTDPRNMLVPEGLAPLMIGLIVVTIGMTFGLNCGYAINPARDLSPRIMTYMCGWGDKVFWTTEYYFIVPVVGPFIGAILGVWLYILIISYHWPPGDTN